MDYVNLGKSGLKVSRICLGMMSYGSSAWRDWVLEEEASRPFVRRALELGINFFDTADMYSQRRQRTSHRQTCWANSRRREEVVIATKVFFSHNPDDPNAGGLSRKHIMDAIDKSL